MIRNIAITTLGRMLPGSISKIVLTLLIIGFAALPAAGTKAMQSPEGANEAPTIDLNGPDVPGLDYAATYVEDEAPIKIVSGQLTISASSGYLNSATITLLSKPDHTKESLDAAADLSGSNIKKEYSSSMGILKLSGRASIETYETVLRSITYHNSSQAPHTNDRAVTFVISDGTDQSAAAKSTVALQAVNDAPLLDNSGDMRLEPINEDDRTQIGNYVSTIIESAQKNGEDRITDPDDPAGTSPEGIAVIEVGDSNGTWQFSPDGGVSWTAFGAVNNKSAVLLDEGDRIRFLPNPNYNGLAAFIFRAWDQTTVATAGERVDASITGGTAAFSVDTESVSIDILAVNDPPIVDLNGPLPGAAYAASFLSSNQPVAISAPDALIEDVENVQIVSLVVTLKNRPNGSQELLTASETRSGIKTTPYNPASGVIRFDGLAPLEDYSAILRSLSYSNSASAINTNPRVIEFVANDGTDNSLASQATLSPLLSNSAPTLDPDASMAFSSILEDDTVQIGDAIYDLLATAKTYPIHDSDPDPRRGFAVVGAENQGGVWQFSVDNGTSWFAIGQVSDGAARLLDQQARIRFLPDADFGGETRTITVRAWDQSEGYDGASAVDTTANGGSTPFSTASVSIPIYIQPLDDPPILSLTEGTTAEFVEGNGPVIVAGPNLSLSDVDSQVLQSATITIKNLPLDEPDILAAVTGGTGISASYDGVSGVLKLSGSAGLSEYQAALRSVSFNNLSNNPNVQERIVSFTAGDGASMSNEVTVPVSVVAVNTPPLLDLNGTSIAGTGTEVYFDLDGVPNGGSVPLSNLLQIEDDDDGTLIGATIFLENQPDGARESINANVTGTEITAVRSEDGRRIEFSGQANAAAYQQVLRTAVYQNSSTYANRAVRTITFSIQDSSSGVAQAMAKVIILPQYTHLPFIARDLSAPPPVEEPNNICQEATSIAVNVLYEFGATDINDWFSFKLLQSASVTVELSDFAPVDGQLLVAAGPCGSLKRLGQNGDYTANKKIALGTLTSGQYYILLINDGPTDLGELYKLRVTAK